MYSVYHLPGGIAQAGNYAGVFLRSDGIIKDWIAQNKHTCGISKGENHGFNLKFFSGKVFYLKKKQNQKH